MVLGPIKGIIARWAETRGLLRLPVRAEISIFAPKSIKKSAKLLQTAARTISSSARGDLNPILGFCFPPFSMASPREIAIRVESGGNQRKQSVSFVATLRTFFVLVIPADLPT
jgi:hypothetical protein